MKEKQEIIYKNVKDLIPYVNNTRTHDEKQVKQIAASIKEFGFTNPVLVGESNDVIAGHGRILAAEKLGIDEVPTIELKGLTEAQKKAYIIADNKLALNAGWDEELLKLELSVLNDLDFDLSITGFDQKEIDILTLDINDFGTSFDLASGDKEPIQQMTFTLADEQAEFIKYNLNMIYEYTETFGNQNKNGNALYEVVKQWAEQKK